MATDIGLFEAIFSQRAIRKLKPDPVSDELVQDVKELLGIPESVETAALLPAGHPIGRYGPTTRRPVEDVTHYERWDDTKT